MSDLKQSVAINIPFWAGDASGVAVLGKVTGDWTKRISKNGAAFAAMTVVVTEMENGWYQAALDTGHTDTLGFLAVTLKATGVLQINERHRVTANLLDDLSARIPAALVSGNMASNVQAVAADAITATAIQNNAITSSKLAASSITATQIAADAITANKIADGAIDAATFAAGAIDAAAIATDAIDADALKADAVTKIAAAIPTAAAIVTALLDSVIDAGFSPSSTVRGALVRMNAAIIGRIAGGVSSTISVFLGDDATKAFEAAQNLAGGTRNKASTINGD